MFDSYHQQATVELGQHLDCHVGVKKKNGLEESTVDGEDVESMEEEGEEEERN